MEDHRPKAPVSLETIFSIVCGITEQKLTVSEFVDLMTPDLLDRLLAFDIERYIAEWDIGKEHYPLGPTLPSRTGGGKNHKHARLPKPKELKKWNDMIDGWEREIIDLKKTQDEGRKRKIEELKNKIRDARDKSKRRAEQHSQRDKGFDLPGFHDAEGLDDEQ